MPPFRHVVKHQCSHLHTSPTSRISSPLFALQALSNSRETQHFNRASGLSRIEHSPNLELLRSSEVDPFKRKKPAAPPVEARQQRMQVKDNAVPKTIPSALDGRNTVGVVTSKAAPALAAASSSTPSAEANALDVGGAVLADHAATRSKLRDEIRDLEERLAAKRKTWKDERKALEKKVEEHEQRRFTNSVLLGIVVIGSAWWNRDRLVRWARNWWGLWQAQTQADTEESLMKLRRMGVGVTVTKEQAVDAVNMGADHGRENGKEAVKSSGGWFWRT